jgi:hypothetical protein
MVSRRREEVVAVGYAPGTVTKKDFIFGLPFGQGNLNNILRWNFVGLSTRPDKSPRSALNLDQITKAKAIIIPILILICLYLPEFSAMQMKKQ